MSSDINSAYLAKSSDATGCLNMTGNTAEHLSDLLIPALVRPRSVIIRCNRLAWYDTRQSRGEDWSSPCHDGGDGGKPAWNQLFAGSGVGGR